MIKTCIGSAESDVLGSFGGLIAVAKSIQEALTTVDQTFLKVLGDQPPKEWIGGLTSQSLLEVLYLKGIALKDAFPPINKSSKVWLAAMGGTAGRASVGSNASVLPHEVQAEIYLMLTALDQICKAPSARSPDQIKTIAGFRKRISALVA